VESEIKNKILFTGENEINPQLIKSLLLERIYYKRLNLNNIEISNTKIDVLKSFESKNRYLIYNQLKAI
jgi:hypothetical protein